MGVTPRIAVLIVDDEALMRAGIRLMIDGVDGIEVVGEASDGRAAIDAVHRFDPDVVLMDIRMPVMSGIDATRALVGAGTRARIVVLTAFDTDAFLLDALRAGALSFLLKDAAPEDLRDAIARVAAGETLLQPVSTDPVRARFRFRDESTPTETFGQREVAILRLITGTALLGQATTLIVVLFLGGVQLISLGIIGEYIGRIYDEAKNRPLYIVAEGPEMPANENKSL